MNASIQSFDDAVRFVLGFANYERQIPKRYDESSYNLDAFRALLKQLDSPEQHGCIIHIAGTKGKGATAAILESLLRKHGFHTGLFTSPHLIDIRERIRIDGKAISEDDFTRFADMIRRVRVEHQAGGGGFRTTFEILTAMAMLAFRQQKVDFTILEVGMGGRLDCTNVVDPVVTAISPVSYDHMESLGHTIREIAAEKAGIIKTDRICVMGRQTQSTRAIISSRANAVNATIQMAPRVKSIRAQSLSGSEFYLMDHETRQGPFHLSLAGRFQVENAALAMGIMLALQKSGHLHLNSDCLYDGFRAARWPGRAMVLDPEGWYPGPHPPLIVIDGAHNPLAMRRLSEWLSDACPGARFATILAVPANKDCRNMIKEIAPRTRYLIVTRYQNARAMAVQDLHAIASCLHPAVYAEDSLESALRRVVEIDPHVPVLVTGSLYLMGELLDRAGWCNRCLDLSMGDTF